MRPVLLRPPEECLPSVKLLTGLPLYSAERSTITSWRWPGVVGLNVFNAIVVSALETGGDVDAVALFEGHHSTLRIGLRTELAAEDLGLALAHQRVHALHLDVEQLLDGFLDLRLGRLAGHLEHDLVVLGGNGRLFGHHGGNDNVVMARVDGGHLKRASNASSAALVRTSF